MDELHARPLARSPSPLPPEPPRIALPLSPTEKKQIDNVEIPWKSIVPLLLYRMADAATYVVIFPFITELITSLHVPHNRIGLYAGLGEGTLMVVEALFAPLWARWSDRYGRRPIMVWVSLFCSIPAVMMGFSNRVWHVILWRGLFGLTPLGVVGKTMVSEISTPATRAKIFSVFSPSFSVGAMVGSFMGGELSHPYGRLPWWLGGTVELFKEWPYALPCICTGAMIVIANIAGIVFLPETRPPHMIQPSDDETGQLKRPDTTYAATLKVPNFALITGVFLSFQFVTMSFDAIYSVYAYTEVPYGGLGLHVDNIGLIMFFSSITYIVLTPLVLPRLIARFGTTRALNRILRFWPVLALSLPVTQFFARKARVLMWVTILVQQIGKNLAAFAWPLNEMLTVAAFDDYPHLLATGTAISLIAGAVGRAVGPAVSGWMYSISTQYDEGSLGRQISWLLLLTLAVPAIFYARFLPRDDEGTKRAGYEAVPLTATTRDSMDEEEEEEVLVASGRDAR